MRRLKFSLALVCLSVYLIAQPSFLDKNGFIKEDQREKEFKKSGVQLLGRFHKVGYAADSFYVAMAYKNNKYALLNQKFEEIIPYTTDQIKFINPYILYTFNGKQKKYFKIGKSGASPLGFSHVRTFMDGYSQAVQEDRICLIDSLANVLFYFSSEFLQPDNVLKADGNSSGDANKVSVINLMKSLGDADPVGSGLFIIAKGNKYHLFTRDGKKVVLPEFAYLSKNTAKDGVKIVGKDGKCGYVNSQGKLALPMIYDEITDNGGSVKSEGRNRMILTKDRLKGMADKNGSILIPCTMKDVRFTSSKNYFVVMKDVQTLLYDSSLKQVSYPSSVTNLINVWERHQGLAYFSWLNNKSIVYDEKGIVKTDPIHYPYFISDSLYMINSGQSYNVLTANLNTLRESSSENISINDFNRSQRIILSMPGQKEIRTSKGRLVGILTHQAFEAANSANEFIISDNGLKGMVDSLDKTLIPLKYQTISRYGDYVKASAWAFNEIYDTKYRLIPGADSLTFVDFMPGGIIYCQKKYQQILIANQQIIFNHRGLIINVGDGLFSVIYDDKTYFIDCYGNTVGTR